jgi:anhydro-N-acetylmuramic acid kinase
MLSIGLMSGTSMDGIDAALLETDGSEHLIKDLGDTTIKYTPQCKILLKAAEYCVRHCNGNMPQAKAYYWQGIADYLINEFKISATDLPQQISALNQYLHGNASATQPITFDEVIQHSTDLHELAVRNLLAKTGYTIQQIDVVGYHGQTLLHRPEKKISIIAGDGRRLAEALQVTVVNDFRSNDVAAGGQGAPFAPLYHFALAVRDKKIPVAVVNCGGIANITVINSSREADLLAFDTGPGNGLIDRLVKQRTQGRELMDYHGKYGGQGRVHTEILTQLYANAVKKNQQNYFAISPPKSLDIGDLSLIPELAALSVEDACATLEAFTADAIVQGLKQLSAAIPHHWVLAGGGWHNPVITRELRQRLTLELKTAPILQTADAAGWNTRAMEAQIFAYLAVRSLQNLPLSLPGTTRVPKPLSGGQVHHPSLLPSPSPGEG